MAARLNPEFTILPNPVDPEMVMLTVDLQALVGGLTNIDRIDHHGYANEGTVACTASGYHGAASITFPVSGRIISERFERSMMIYEIETEPANE